METNYLKCRTYEGVSSNRGYLEIVSRGGIINTTLKKNLPFTEKGLQVNVIGEDNGRATILLPPEMGLEVITVDVMNLAA